MRHAERRLLCERQQQRHMPHEGLPAPGAQCVAEKDAMRRRRRQSLMWHVPLLLALTKKVPFCMQHTLRLTVLPGTINV